MSASRLLIVLMNTDPRNPEELGAPFYYAAVAAAMDHPVDVLCTATAGKLMLKGVAEAITITKELRHVDGYEVAEFLPTLRVLGEQFGVLGKGPHADFG